MFYISSLGSSANTWINKMLSKHPKIVCFGSSRSFPPVWPGFTYPFKGYKYDWIREISAEKYINSLYLCSKSVHEEKFFGSIHGYHGLLAKEPCEKLGGIFSYISRNPISRIHSVFIHSCEKNFYTHDRYLENKHIHRRTCEILKEVDLVNIALNNEKISQENSIKKNSIKFLKNSLPNNFKKKIKEIYSDFKIKSNTNEKFNINEKQFLTSQFISHAKEFIRNDKILFDNCTSKAGIKMEELVQSHQYFKNNLITRVKPGLEVTSDYLNQVFSSKKVNTHRDLPLNDEEIWKDWPESMKQLYYFYFEKYELKKFCNHFDYKIL
jgi:hypothetical protein